MKKLILLLTLSTNVAMSQSVHQKEIIDFVRENVGKRVGSGICSDLVVGAMKSFDKGFSYSKATLGEKVAADQVQPGDVIRNNAYVDETGERFPSHVAIVYAVKNGKVYVAEQNVACNSLKESKVVITECDVEEEIYEIYRPN